MSPAVETLMDVIQPERAKEFGLEHEADVKRFVGAPTLAVVDVLTCQQAVDLRTEIKRRQQKIAEFFAPLKDAAFKMHRAICQREHDVLDPLASFDSSLQASIKTWNDEQAEIARARERELAEQRRHEEEARAITEAAALEEAALTVSTREEAADLLAQADAVVQQAITAPAPVVVVQSAAAQVTGLKTRRVWGWRFVGGPKAKKDVVRETPPAILARALSRMPREYLTADVRKIDGIVKSMEGLTSIPGVEVFYDDIPVR